MKGSTVELRRAAVFALAATHGAKAVPALLDIARTTADESVRAAAIEMIEKLARGAAAEPVAAPKAAVPPAGTPASGRRPRRSSRDQNRYFTARNPPMPSAASTSVATSKRFSRNAFAFSPKRRIATASR